MPKLKTQNKPEARTSNHKIPVLMFVVLILNLFYQGAYAFELADLDPIRREDKILILAPHPDDEALGCAGVIQEALRRKAQVKVMYLTNGDHNQLAFIVYEKRLVFRKGEFIHMGEIRRKEAVKAMSLLGLKEESLIFLGYPDFGTFAMFTRYWQAKKPFKSLLTRLNKVPYPDNFSYGKYFVPENILSDLKRIIGAYRPNKIFVSHPADTNGDHRSLWLFLNIALWDMGKKIPPPKVYAYLVHHSAWPLPRRYHPVLGMGVPRDLEDTGRWFSLNLGPDAVKKKYNALGLYKSQTQSSAFYLFSFARINEIFQVLPFLNPASRPYAPVDRFISYCVQNNHLVVRLRHPVDNHDISRVSMYAFGYRSDMAFATMPKIFLKIGPNTLIVSDGRRRLENTAVSHEMDGQDTIIKVPLELLNNPDKALISVRVSSRDVPYVQSIWSRVRLK